MKPFFKMDAHSFSIKKTALLLPALQISLNSTFAFAVEKVSSPKQETSSSNDKELTSKEKSDNRNRANDEKLENQLELFLDGKIKGNSLVILREKAPDFDNKGEVIKKIGTEEHPDNLLTRIKIPAKSSITGISCNGIREFFKNEGITTFSKGSALENLNITQGTIIEYFNAPEIKKHFSERTRNILSSDFKNQLKEKFSRIPQACFADIVEPSGEKHTVYFTHKNIRTQTADYSPEYELIDFTYDQNYLSPVQETTKSEKE